MTVREYIGARYVPLFMGQWDIAIDYEALCVVQYQGDSYTSRQPVPAGTDIFNEEYWLESGNYNAQVEAYRQEVFLFDGRIDDLEDSVDDLEDTVGDENSGLVKDVIDLKAKDVEFDADIEAIETITEKLETRNFMGGYLAPCYVGDFMANEQFTTCLRVSDNIYCFSTDNWNGNGTLRVFNLLANALVSTKTIYMGHGNSVCYDSVRDKFWIAPMFSYSDGETTDVDYILQYNPSFTSYSQKTIPSNSDLIYGLSFDSVTNILYAFVAQDPTKAPVKIYRMLPDESEFSFWKSTPEIGTVSYGSMVWQDFAVHDNKLLCVKAEGTVYCYDLELDTLELGWTFRIGFRDDGNIWQYGEVEGLEFDDEGRLYNARNAPLGQNDPGTHHSINCCFVTELNTKDSINTAYSSKQTVYGTLTVQDSFNTKFALARNEIRSMNQIYWRSQKTAVVVVPEGETYTDGYIRLLIDGGLTFRNEGITTILGFIVQSGTFFLYNMGTLTMNTEYQGISSNNNAIIFYYRNEGTMNLPTVSRFIQVGYSPTIMCIANLGTYTGENATKFQDAVVSTPGMLMGNRRIYGTSSE